MDLWCAQALAQYVHCELVADSSAKSAIAGPLFSTGSVGRDGDDDRLPADRDFEALQERIKARRRDPEFQTRQKERIEREHEALDRLPRGADEEDDAGPD